MMVRLESGKEVMATPWMDSAWAAFRQFEPDDEYLEKVCSVFIKSKEA